MKIVSKSHIDDSKCSCESCLYRSESDRPSFRTMLSRGSRIDRLYYGKYIPLREKKLIDRLVRTRAVYNDIRAQLLSDSTSSHGSKANFVLKNKLSAQNLEDTAKSRSILKLVGMVDKGEIFRSKNIGDCCSCCSCSSKIHIRNKSVRKQRHKHFKRYENAYTRKKGVQFKAKHIRSDPCTCTLKFSRLLKNHSKTMLRKLHTDTLLPVDLQATTDEDISRKQYKIADVAHASYQNVKQSMERVSDTLVEGIKKLNESKTKIPESFELKPKTSLEKLKHKGKVKMKKSNKNEISNKINARICECPEIDLVSQIKKDSVGKFEDDLKKKRMLKDWECESECIATTCDPEECFIKLRRKRPHIKIGAYREKRKRIVSVKPISQSNNNVQVDIKKIKPILRAQQTEEIKSRIETNKNVQDNFPKNKTHPHECTCEEKSKENVKTPKKSSSKISAPKIKTGIRKKAKVNRPIKNQIVFKREAKPMNVASERSSRQAVRIGSSFTFNIEFYKNRAEPITQTLKLPSKPTLAIKYNNDGSKNKENLYNERHNRSSHSLSKPKEKNKPISRRHLKRCFCTLKLKDRKSRPKIKKRVTKETMTTDRSLTDLNSFLVFCRPYDCIKNECNSLECKKTALKNIQTDTYNSKGNRRKLLLPYQCEPGICIPNYCDPHRCIKINNIKNTKIKKRSVKCSYCPSITHSRKTKSTSSLTSRSYALPKAKYVQSVIVYTKKPKNIRGDPVMQRPNYQRRLITTRIDSRQAVRIGSTFSFNIEFYKDKLPYNIPPRNHRSLAIKHEPIKLKHPKKKLRTQGLQKSLSSIYLTNPTQITKKDRKTNIGLGLKRCFCTLKLQGKKYTKDKQRKMLNAGTETKINSYLDVNMLNRNTKMDHKDLTLLEPFECKPFACIPGECNPYVCLEKIKKRKKLKDASIATKLPIMEKGSSTVYSKTSSKTIQAHYPYSKAKHQKTRNKLKSTTGSIRKIQLNDQTPKQIRDKKSVNIGSSFSFIIEFSKSRSPMSLTQSEKWPERMTAKNNAIGKKIKINTHVDNENMQIKRSINYHKASMINPFLKKCFCTLNLQKKRKKHFHKKSSANSLNRNLLLPPRIYTVNAMTEEVRNHSYLKIFKNSRSNSNQLCIVKSNCEYRMSIKQFSPIANKSTFISKNREYIEETFRPLNSLLGLTEVYSKLSTDKRRCLKTNCKNNLNKPIVINGNGSFNISNDNINTCIEQTKISSPHLKQKQSNHAIHYLKKCFYVMNLQIENNNHKHFPIKRSKSVDVLKNNKIMQLLPYECEPGICVPGECNPYECQKLILKRTMKNNSTKIGAKDRKSISNNTRVLRSKSTQNNRNIYVKKLSPENNKILSDYSKNRAVRIGSNFDFSVEFSKNNKISRNHFEEDTLVTKLLSNTKTRRLKEQTSKSLKSVRPRIKDHKYNIQSQSRQPSITHRASMILPMFKRCSCTLKLHKKGRLHKRNNLKKIKSPYVQNIQIHTNSRGQNTKKIKPFKKTQELDPYECQPNICDPGKCEPYHCFKMMKSTLPYYKTNASGTETTLYKNNSTHSMTKKNKSKATQKELPLRILQRDKVRPNLKTETDATRPNSLIPSRQVVRVGSSFSFNIDFFKDRLPCHNEPIVSNEKDLVKLNYDLKDIKQKHSAVSIAHSTKNKKSQMQSIPQIASTTTSFAKRCFCTSKLYQNKKKYIGLNLRKNAKPSFFKKCLCWLKKKKSLTTVNKGHEINKNKHFDKKNISQNKMRSDMHTGRYDCEPGICVLGDCDLLECDAIRRKRLRKRSQSSTSPFIRSRSTHMYVPTRITRNAKTQSIVSKNIKNAVKPLLTKSSSDHIKKQLVRIGSNFSFNIEFYKSNMLKNEHLNSQLVSGKSWHNRNKANGSKIKKNTISVHSRYSQAILPKKNNHSIGVNNIMKRCFCTLQFYNKSKETKVKAKMKSVITENSKLSPITLLSYECEPNFCIANKCDAKQCDKIIQTRKERYQHKLPVQAKLLPNECEPLTCIPGQCNPIKCLERIIKRQNESKHIGTAIDAHNTTSTMTKVNIKPKNKRSQSTKSMTVQKIPDFKLHAPNFHKQAVKIGSKFSFEIEFYKDNESGSNSYENMKNNTTRQNKLPNITKRHQRSSFPFISSKIQVPHVEQKGKKPVILPFLKKCFCIFKLHNKETKTYTRPIQFTDQNYVRHMNNNKSRIMERKNMLPFECEPNICVPSLCDPYECEKRIQKRLKAFGQKTENILTSSKLSGTDKIDFKSIKSQDRKGHLSVQERKEKSPHGEFQRYRQANVNNKVYRIGSIFSYDVEFFKNRYPKNTYFPNSKYMTNKKNTKRANNSDVKLVGNYISDTKQLKEKSKSNYKRPYLERCFCTVKLQKRPIGSFKTPSHDHETSFIEPKIQLIPTKSNGTTCTLIYPYACDKRIQVKSKPRNRSSQVVRLSSDKYTSIKAKKNNRKIQKNYITKLNDFSNQNDNENGKRIVEVPRNVNGFGKQAVKIGSNFNFHIDFYKHTVTQPRKNTFSNDYKKSDYVKKKRTSIKPFYLNNLNSKTSIVHSKDKGMVAENILKRCLCTLKLQNTNLKPTKKNVRKTLYYPQIVEVRRVYAQQKPKIVSQKAYALVEAKANQSKIKYINEGLDTQCLYSFCQHCGDNNPNSIHTIYPYVPKKFNKRSSITLVSMQNIPIDQHFKAKVYSKNLTKKKGQIMINLTKQLMQELPKKAVSSRIKFVICQCISLFKSKKDYSSYNCTSVHQYNFHNEKSNIKQEKCNLDNFKAHENNIYCTEKHAKNKIHVIKSKSLKLIRRNKNAICQNECPCFLTSKNFLQQVGDDDPNISLKFKKKINLEKIRTKEYKYMSTNNSEDEHARCKSKSLVTYYKKNLDVPKFPERILRSSEKYEKRKLLKNSRSFKLSAKTKNTTCVKKYPYFITHLEGDYGLKHLPMKKNEDLDIYSKCLKMNKNIIYSPCQNTMQKKNNQNKSSSPQLKIHFLDSLVISHTFIGDKNKIIICNKNKSKKNFEYLNSCRPGRIINAEEIQKAAGDYYGHKMKS